ncbi:MAG TPA: Gx transporter family protein [Eubacteriaceae bacterium]|nr:Gx transporter family protein [Eubacteriaceae bacterium]
MTRTKKLIFISILLAQALVLQYIEGFIPIPIPAPGVKLGLANIVIMITIVIFGLKVATTLVVLRSFMGAMFVGTISSFFFSLGGGLLSLIAMYILFRYYKDYFSFMGISIVGAIFHNIGQLFVASLVISNFGIFTYLPILMLSGILTGYFVGLATKYILDILSINLKILNKTNKI